MFPAGGNRVLGIAVLLAGSLASRSAHAHIKWFADYDLTKPPLPIGEVLTRPFVTLFLASLVFIYAFFWVDRAVLRKGILEDVLRRYTLSEPRAFMIMRAAAFLFFASVGLYGFMVRPFFLTPELTTYALWIPGVQIGIALCALNRRTVPLIGLGMILLYSVATYQYGIFHLLDYVIRSASPTTSWPRAWLAPAG